MSDSPLRHWVSLVQAHQGYPVSTELKSKEETPAPPRLDAVLRVEDVASYLDDVISRWRQIRDYGDTFADKAPHYIDAYQSVRVSLLGETLP